MIFNKQVQLKAFTYVLQLWFISFINSLPIIYDSITDNVNIVCPPILNDSVQNGFLHRIVACSFDTQNCSYQIEGFVKSIDIPSSKQINSSFYLSNGVGYIYGKMGSFRFKIYKKYFLDIHNFDVYLTMAYYVDGAASWNYYISMSDDQNEYYSYTYITRNASSSDLWNILNARFNLTNSAMNSNFTFSIYGSGGFIKFDDLCIYQVCKEGYMFNESTNQCEDIIECATTCNWMYSNCTNTPGSFMCTCNLGFQLDINKSSCIDTCVSACHPNASCVGLNCNCNSGFIGNGFNNCEATCSSECHPNATCVGTSCICHSSFIGDGVSICEATCSNHCHPNATCVDTNCVCKKGFFGDGVRICEALCSGACHPNSTCADLTCVCNNGFIGDGFNNCTASCSSACHPKATCVDTTCVCNNGFVGDGINNCTASCSSACHPNATCVDTTCVCKNGFVGDGIHNCTASCSSACHPNATCVDITCVCNNGFIGDGINNCTASCSSACHPNATCVDITCVCNNGFIGDGINDCTASCSSACHPNATCVDTTCVCKNGFVGDGIHNCTASCSSACHPNATCVDITCVCNNGFIGDGINNCTASCSSACHPNATCVDTTCVCNNGFIGDGINNSSCSGECHPNATCVDTTCVCKNGFIDDGNNNSIYHLTSENLSTALSLTTPMQSTTMTTMYQINELTSEEKEYCNFLLNLCYYHQSSIYCLRVFKSCPFTLTVSSTTTLSPSTAPLTTTTNLSTTLSLTSPIESTTLTTMHQTKDLTTEEKLFCNCLLNLCYHHKSLNYCLRVLNSCSTMTTTSSTTLPSLTTIYNTSTITPTNLSSTISPTSVEPIILTSTYELVYLSNKEKEFCNCLLNLCHYHMSLNYCLRVLKSCSTKSTTSSTTLSPSTTASVEPTTQISTFGLVDLSIKEKEFCNCLLNLCYYHKSLNYCLRVLKSCSTTSTTSSPTLPSSTTVSVESTTVTSTYGLIDLSIKEKEFCNCLLNLCYYHKSLNYCLRVLKSCSTTSTTSSPTLPSSTTVSVESTTVTSTYGLIDLSIKEKEFCNCLLNLCYYYKSLNYCLRVLNSCSTTSTTSSTTLPPSATTSVEPTTLTSNYGLVDLSIKEKEFCNCLLKLCYYHKSLNYCLRVLNSCSTTSTTTSITLSPSTTTFDTSTTSSITPTNLSSTISSTPSVEPTTLISTSRLVDLSIKEKEFCNCLLNLCYYHMSLNYCLRVLKSCLTTSTTSLLTLPPSTNAFDTSTTYSITPTNLSSTIFSTSSVESTTLTSTYGLFDLSIKEKEFCNCLLKLCYYHKSLNYCLRVLNSCSTTSTTTSITLSSSTTTFDTSTTSSITPTNLSSTISSTPSVEPTTLISTSRLVDLSIKEKEFCNCLLNLCYYHMSLNYCLRVLKSCSTTSTTSLLTLPPSTNAFDTSTTYAITPTNLSSTISSTSSVESTALTSTYGLVDLSFKEKEFCNCLLNLCYYHMSLNYCLRVLKSCSTTSTTSSTTLPPSTNAFDTSTTYAITPTNLSSTISSTSSVESTALTSTYGLVDLSFKEKEFCNCLLNLCYYHMSLNYCLRVLKSCSTTSTTSSTTLPPSTNAFDTSTTYAITPTNQSSTISSTSLVESTTLTSTYGLVDLSLKEKEFCNCLLNLCYYHKSLNYCLRVFNSCSTTSTTTSLTLPSSTKAFVTSTTLSNLSSTISFTSSLEQSTLTSTSASVDLSTKEKEFCNCLLKLCYYHKSLSYCLRVFNSCSTTSTTTSLTLPSSTTAFVTSTTLSNLSSTISSTSSLEQSTLTSTSASVDLSTKGMIYSMSSVEPTTLTFTSEFIIFSAKATAFSRFALPLTESTKFSTITTSPKVTDTLSMETMTPILPSTTDALTAVPDASSIVTLTQLYESSTMFIINSLTPSEFSLFSDEISIFISDPSITETMVQTPTTMLVLTSTSVTTKVALTTSPKYPLTSFEASTKTTAESSMPISTLSTFSSVILYTTVASSIVTPTQLYELSTMIITASLTPSKFSSFLYKFSISISDPSITETKMQTPTTMLVPTSTSQTTKVALTTSPEYPLTLFETSTKTTAKSSVPILTKSTFSKVVSNSTETLSIVTPTQLYDSSTMFITASLTPSELSSFLYEFSIETSDSSITESVIKTPKTVLVPTSISVITEVELATSPKYPLTSFKTSTKTTEVSTVAISVQISTSSYFSTVVSNSIATLLIVTPRLIYDSSAMFITASSTPSKHLSLSYEFSIKTSDSSITETVIKTPTTMLVPTSISVTTEVELATLSKYPLTLFETPTKSAEVSTVAISMPISTTTTFSPVVSNSTETSLIVTPTLIYDSSVTFITASLTPSELSSFSYEFSIKTSHSSITETILETPTTMLVPTSISLTTEVALTTSTKYPLSLFETSTKSAEVPIVASSVPISTTSTFSPVVSNSTETSLIVTPTLIYDSSVTFITASLTPSELSSFSFEFSIKTYDSSIAETILETPTTMLVPTSISLTTEVALTTSTKYSLSLFETSTKSAEVPTVASSVPISTTSTFSTVVSNSIEFSSIVTPTQLYDSSIMFITSSLTPSELSSFSFEFSIKTYDSSITETIMDTPTTMLVSTSISVTNEVALTTSTKYPFTLFETSIKSAEVSTVASSVLISLTSFFPTVFSNSIGTSSIGTPTLIYDSSTMFITASLTPIELSSFSYEFLIKTYDSSVKEAMVETSTTMLVPTSISLTAEVALTISPKYPLTLFETLTKTTEVSTVASSVPISTTSTFSKVVSNSIENSSIVTPTQRYDSSTMFITSLLISSELSLFSYEFSIKTYDSSITETILETPTTMLVPTSISLTTEVTLTISPKYPLTLFETSTKTTEVSTVASSVPISTTSTFSKVVSNSIENSSIVTPSQRYDSSTMFITSLLISSELSLFSYEFSIKTYDSSITETILETPTTMLVPTSISLTTEVALTISPKYSLTLFKTSTKTTEVSTVASSVPISTTSTFSTVVSNSSVNLSIITPTLIYDLSTMFNTALLTPSELSSFSFEFSIKISDSLITETMMETPITMLVPTSISVTTEVALTTSLKYPLTLFETSIKSAEVSTVASSVLISTMSFFSTVFSNSIGTSSIGTPTFIYDSSTMFITASLTSSELSLFSYEFSIKTYDSSITETIMETPTTMLVPTSISLTTEVALATSPKYPLTSFKSSTKTTEVSTGASSVSNSTTSTFSTLVSNSPKNSLIITPTLIYDLSTMFNTSSLTPIELSSFSYEFSIKTSDSSITETILETPTTMLVPTNISVTTEVALTTSTKYPLTLFETSIKSAEVSTVASSVLISTTSFFSTVFSNSIGTSSYGTPTLIYDSSTMFITASLTSSELLLFSFEFSIKTYDSSITETIMDTPTTMLVPISISVTTEVELTTSLKYLLTSFKASTKTTEVSTGTSSVSNSTTSTFSTVVSNSAKNSLIITPTLIYDLSTMFITSSLTPSELSLFSYEFSIKTSDSLITETMMETPTTMLVPTSISVTTEVALTTSPKYPLTLFETSTKSAEVSTVATSLPISTTATFSIVVLNSTYTSSIVTPTQLYDSSTKFITASLTPSELSSFSYEFSIKISDSSITETMMETPTTMLFSTVALSATTLLTTSSLTILTTASTTSNEILFTTIKASTSAESESSTLVNASAVFTTTTATTTNVPRIISSTSFEIVIPADLTNNKDIKMFYIILVKLLSGSILAKRRPPSSYTWEEIGNHTDGLYLVGILETTSNITKFIIGKGSSRKRRDTNLIPDNPPLESGASYSTFVIGVKLDNTTETSSYSDIVVTSPITTTTTQSSTTKTQSSITTTQTLTTTTQSPTTTTQSSLKCQSITIGDEHYKGRYTFNLTSLNNVETIDCANNNSLKFQNKCILNSSNLAEWEYHDPPDCPPKSETSKQLLNLTKIQVTDSNAEETATSLSEIVKVKNLTTSYEINLISDVIENIINVSSSQVVTKQILSTIDVVLSLDKTMIDEANKNFNSSTALLSHLDDLGKQQKENITIAFKNLAFASYSIKINQNPIYIYSTQANNANVNISSEDPKNSAEVIKAFIKLPSNMFYGRNESQIYSYLYLEKKLFANNTAIDSVVLAVTVNGEPVNNTNIFLMFLRDSNNTRSRTCRYYKTTEKIWSTNGCNTINNSLPTVYCTCDHLTNFALILDVDQSGNNSLSLRIMSWIGCGISIAGLFITILSYTLSRY
ncbi:mucin-3A-like isoform X3 [Hydra vulgaris]|uniref:Mucin-3A-like isoform X3 n=1 Tax=Hydra vulgaris TaxID=6087 RepID=A0ABM4C7N6_HYDVU